MITKAQVDEKRLYVDNMVDWSAPPKVAKVPPAPVLMSRTHTRMVFRPAAFTPSSGENVRTLAENSLFLGLENLKSLFVYACPSYL